MHTPVRSRYVEILDIRYKFFLRFLDQCFDIIYIMWFNLASSFFPDHGLQTLLDKLQSEEIKAIQYFISLNDNFIAM